MLHWLKIFVFKKEVLMARGLKILGLFLLAFALAASFGACGQSESKTSAKKNAHSKKKKSRKKITYPKQEIYLPGDLSPEDFQGPADAVTFAFAGDIMLWETMQKPIEKHGVKYPFEAVAELFQTADYAVGNLECPIAVKSEKRGTKGFFYKVPPFTLEGLKWAGFDMVSLANNHVRDCGDDGLIETFGYLEEAGISYFGAGKNKAEAMEPVIVEVKGLKVAFVGFLSPEIYWYDIGDLDKPGRVERQQKKLVRDLAAKKERPGTIIASKKTVRRMVEKARENADLVIVVPHWGVRYHQPVWEDQEILGRAAVDAGADLVVGHHNHIRQAVEVYKGKPIIYGIGNFAFGSGNRSAFGGFLVRAVVRNNKVEQVRLYPTFTSNREKQVKHQVKILKGKSAEKELEKIRKMSAERGADFRIENGVGVLDL